MFIHRKLTTGCAVAVLAFGLAACGSGSDNSARDSLQEELDALQSAYGADDLTPAGITQLQTDLADKIAEIGSADEPTEPSGQVWLRRRSR